MNLCSEEIVFALLPGMFGVARIIGGSLFPPKLGLTQLSNYLTFMGSFSAVSKPNFATKYAMESSGRDLQNALLCAGLVGSVWVKKYTDINIAKMKSGSQLNLWLENR